MAQKNNIIEFTVNGKKCRVGESISLETTLNAYLRYTLALPGTKAMCHEGGCGACVVAVRAPRLTTGITELFSVNSCLVLVHSCHGWEITTIEAVGNRLNGYDDIQERIVKFGATQCGYCTPGWAMHLYSLRDKNLTMLEMERAFASNTCRCTGFRPIMDTVKSYAVNASPDLCQKVRDIEELKICKKTNAPCERKCSVKSVDSDWSMIMEDSLKLDEDETKMLASGDHKFYRVVTEEEIFKALLLEGSDSYMLIDGNTGKGVYDSFDYPRVLIDISGVKSLKTYKIDQNLVLGANIALEDLITIFKDTAKSRSEFAYLNEFAKHLDLVAHMPVRKIGSVAGNLMLKHAMPDYQSDLFVILETVGAQITVRNSWNFRKTLSLPQFLKYDMVSKLMISIELPPLSSSHVCRTYKIMPRHQNALALVNAGFLLKINPKTSTISEASIVYGNISGDFIHATNTEKYLKGQNIFKDDTLQSAIDTLRKEIVPKELPLQPTPEIRRKIAVGLFYKFILGIAPPSAVAAKNRSGGQLLTRPVSKGTQDYQSDKTMYPLNKSIPKIEAKIQSAGEAQYANDIPPIPHEVFAAFALSTVFSGKVDQINVKKLLKTEGVIAVYTAKDFPGKNSFIRVGFQLATEDEEILATDIKFYGQPVAIVVANSQALAAKAAEKLEITYKDVKTTAPILTINEAKNANRLREYSDGIEPTSKGDNVTKIIKGVYEVEAQYHYYMEPISSVVVPVDGLLEVYDSSQWIDLTQACIAQCLNIKESDVVVQVRRVGGGFGGKISRNVQAVTACALVAKLNNVPCRFVLPLKTNLTIAGRRLPSQCNYEVGVNDDGLIQYLKAAIIEDDGCTHNENILSFTAGGFPNCYDVSRFKLTTAAVLTDLPSNTYARAPGTAEGISSIEHIMEHIAYVVKKDPTEVRKINMRKEDNDLPNLIDEWIEETAYEKRAKEIEQFNQAHRWTKKAISLNVMCFPVQYFGNYSAMVAIYRGDGSVTVTTGGIEMGQGSNTKAAQACAYALKVPFEMITVLPHYSFTAANNVFAGSSIVSECAIYAAMKACNIIKERLKPIRDSMTNPTWFELITKAADEEIDLTAVYMMTDKEDDLSNYYSYAVVVLEAQLDMLTGQYELLRSDILEDVGLSANPGIDVGQVEGGYIQGLGYFTTEKLVYDKGNGKLLSNRSLYYHVPLALDCPVELNVKLRYNSRNPLGVMGAKAVGEMGICTAHGVNHVLRRCIQESRNDSGYDKEEFINIPVPYDTETILKALSVKYSEMVLTK